MKIVCDGLDLSDAILKVSKGTSSKTTNPILEGIKITADEDFLTLLATDLEISITKKIMANVKIEGETVVPGKFMCEYIKKLNDEQIELDLDEKNILSIKYTDSCGKIQCLNTKEFPETKKLDYSEHFEISQKNLKSLINKSVFAVAIDETRPILKGVKWELNDKFITAVALDGYRLAKVSKAIISSNISNNEVIVPARAMREIANLLEDKDDIVKVFIQRNHLMVEVDNTKIETRLLDGDFINYKQILPSSFNSTVIINKGQLEDAIERASLLSRIDKNNLIRFKISDKVMVLTSQSEIGDIKENITISLSGNDITIAFNARYFSEALRSVNDEFIKMNFTTTIAPCIITPNDADGSDDYLFLILPVRLI